MNLPGKGHTTLCTVWGMVREAIISPRMIHVDLQKMAAFWGHLQLDATSMPANYLEHVPEEFTRHQQTFESSSMIKCDKNRAVIMKMHKTSFKNLFFFNA